MRRLDVFRTIQSRLFLILLGSTLLFTGLSYIALNVHLKDTSKKARSGMLKELAYHFVSEMQENGTAKPPFIEETTLWLKRKADSYSLSVLLSGPERSKILFDSGDFPPLTASESAIEVPYIVDGELKGYLRAALLPGRELSHFGAEYEGYTISQSLNLFFGFLAFIALLFSFWIAKRFAQPFKISAMQAEEIFNGNRTPVFIPRGPDELQTIIRIIRSLLDEFNDHEAWRQQLMQDLAHELRTPLASVLTRMEALIDGIYPATGSHLENMYAELERLTRLVKDVEKLSDAEGARFRLNMQETDMVQFVEYVHESFAFLAEEKGIRFVSVAPHVPCMLRVDADRLMQVLSNFVANALKYTAENGSIAIGMERYPDYLKFYCSDNGIGISEPDLPLLFNRFYRADKSRSRESGGLGVGLSIAKVLVEAHGGLIGAESKQGTGSTFWFTLPLPND